MEYYKKMYEKTARFKELYSFNETVYRRVHKRFAGIFIEDTLFTKHVKVCVIIFP